MLIGVHVHVKLINQLNSRPIYNFLKNTASPLFSNVVRDWKEHTAPNSLFARNLIPLRGVSIIGQFFHKIQISPRPLAKLWNIQLDIITRTLESRSKVITRKWSKRSKKWSVKVHCWITRAIELSKKKICVPCVVPSILYPNSKLTSNQCNS